MMVKCIIRDLMRYLLATTLLHKAYHLCCDYAVPLGSFFQIIGRVQLASDFGNRLRAAISWHLTQTSKEST